eukprot:5513295-Alexandrium_andersonii.AAC.1
MLSRGSDLPQAYSAEFLHARPIPTHKQQLYAPALGWKNHPSLAAARRLRLGRGNRNSGGGRRRLG